MILIIFYFSFHSEICSVGPHTRKSDRFEIGLQKNMTQSRLGHQVKELG